MTDRDVIADWLARNGGARRFEMGASADPTGLRSYLEQRGYATAFTGVKGGRRCRVTDPPRTGADGRRVPGRVRTFNTRELIAFVDELRRQEGLEPLLPQPQQEPHRAVAHA